MSVVKRPGRSSVAFVVALTLLLAFVVPFVGTALAGHNTNHDLDCTPENAQNPTGTEHDITCTVSGDPQTNVEIDFEITGANDPDNSDSPTSPDFTCNTGADAVCTLSEANGGNGWGDTPSETAAAGTSTIRAWIDDDQDNTTVDADTAEGPNAGNVGNTADEAGASGTRQPGNVSEVDDTDVVLKTWFAAFSADATLDCSPETATNPSSGPNSSEVYTCTLFDDNGAGGGTANDDVQNGSEARIQGIRLDAEVEGDPNDPDNGANGPTADFNDACTTDANGQCQVTIPAGESQAGTTTICIWADPDADNQFTAGGDPNDGGECAGEGDEDANQTDRVSKTWVAPGTAVNLDASPESDQNAAGTSHTMTATVTDINGAPVTGVEVDFIVNGRNAGNVCDGITTNSSGVASCTYTDVGTPVGPVPATDEIDVCVDNDDNDACDDGVEAADVEDTDTTDRVQKFWFDTIPPTAQVVVDMDGGCGGETSSDAQATNSVGTVHDICISTFSNATTNAALPGEQVTVTLDGPGHFTTFAVWDDRDNVLDGVSGSEDLGDTITVTTDENGEATVYIYSEVTGNTVVTATADNQSDSGTKIWDATHGREIDCTPETATNQLNTTHTIVCTALDQFGNPVAGEDIDVVENGPGSISTSDDPCSGCTFYEQNNATVFDYVTDANGEIEIVTNSSTEGTQTIEAAFEDDSDEGNGADFGRATQSDGDDDDECDLETGSSFEDEGWIGFSSIEDDTRADSDGVCFDAVTKTWSTAPPTPSGGFPRTVTLESSKNKVTYGNGFTLTATVSAGSTDTPASCVQGVTVTFQREIVGTAGTEIVGTSTTDANGEASLEMTGDRSANYVASVDQTAQCSDATSSAEAVLVKKKVKLRVSDQTPRRGTIVRFKVKVLPCGGTDGPGHEGDRAQLYKTVGGVLSKIAAKRTNDNCVAVFKRRVRSDSTFQGRSPKQDDDHLGGKSRKKAVQVHR